MKVLHEFKQKIGSGDSEKEYTVKLKDISRRDKANLAVVYNAEYGKALSKGLAPNSTLRKRVLDGGGLLTKSEIEKSEELYRSVISKLNEKTSLTAEGKTEEANSLNTEIEDLWAEYQEYEKPANILYSRSAEFEAEKNSVMWAIFTLTYINKDEVDREVFPGATHDSKLNYYYECLDQEKELEIDIFDKAYACFAQAIKNPDSKNEEYFNSITQN